MDLLNKKAAVFVAHPGHVLRVHHWLEIAKPLVFVMTGGETRDLPAQLPPATLLFEKLGARRSAIYGRWSDAAVYEAILNRDAAPFVAATREFADALVAEGIDYVAGDASEGYNCTHELCRYIINSGLALAEKETGRRIPNYEFLLMGAPNACPEALRDRALRVELDDAALDRKIAAAEAFYSVLGQEVAQQIGKYGREPFMVEYLTPASLETEPEYSSVKAAYEAQGEKQVASGKYQHVIRYREHFQPLVRKMRDKLGLGTVAAAE